MTQVVDGVLYISAETERECKFCHDITEVRPYGPDNQDICAGCAELPQYEDAVNANLGKMLDGVRLMVVGKPPCAESV